MFLVALALGREDMMDYLAFKQGDYKEVEATVLESDGLYEMGCQGQKIEVPRMRIRYAGPQGTVEEPLNVRCFQWAAFDESLYEFTRENPTPNRPSAADFIDAQPVGSRFVLILNFSSPSTGRYLVPPIDMSKNRASLWFAIAGVGWLGLVFSFLLRPRKS